jgi:hypothetical protein
VRPGADSTLGARERLVSILAAIGLAALGGLLFSDGGSMLVQGVLGAIVVLLVLVGLVGRAPAFVREVLFALTGTAR